MIHAKQWHYSLHRDFQQLHSIHSTRGNPRDSSSTNSTFRRQRALRVILHTEGKEIFYPVYKDLQGIPVLQGHSRHSSHSWYSSPTGITTRSSTLQYNPVPSSAIQCIQGFHPFQHFFNQNTNSTHRLVSTRNSIECQSNTRQYILQTFHSSKKGRCCDMSQYDTIGKIELIPPSALSSRVTNCYNDIHKFSYQFELSRVNRDSNLHFKVLGASKHQNDTSHISSLM